jgi:hypothetical protein
MLRTCARSLLTALVVPLGLAAAATDPLTVEVVPHPPGTREAEYPTVSGLSADGELVYFRVEASPQLDAAHWVWSSSGGLVQLPAAPRPIFMEEVSMYGGTWGGVVELPAGIQAGTWSPVGGITVIGAVPHPLGPSHSTTSSVTGLSHDGTVATLLQDFDLPYEGPFAAAWSAESGLTVLSPSAPNRRTIVHSISGNGRVLGGHATAPVTCEDFPPCVEIEGVVQPFEGFGEPQACLWVGGVELLLPRDIDARDVLGLSYDGGVVLGLASRPEVGGGTDLFSWSASTGYSYLDMETVHGGVVGAMRMKGVSLDGRRAVGYHRPSSGAEIRGYLWDAEAGVRAIKDVLVDGGFPFPAGWWQQVGLGISHDGRTILFDIKDPALPGFNGQTYRTVLPAPWPLLGTDTESISLASGGAQVMTLDAGAAHADALYLVLGSASGVAPGLAGDTHVPLNFDAYLHWTLLHPNTLIAASFGFLDGAGGGVASVSLPGGAFPDLAGVELFHAYLVIDPVPVELVAASNAALLRLLP